MRVCIKKDGNAMEISNGKARRKNMQWQIQVEAGYLGWRLAQDFTMITGEDRRLIIKKKNRLVRN